MAQLVERRSPNIPVYSQYGFVKMVGGTGIEPVTPCVSSKCSTAELTAHSGICG